MNSKEQSIYLEALMYTVCYDITNKTPIVDKWLKQIKKGLRKLSSDDYKVMSIEVHEAWGVARKSIITKDSKLNVKMSELLMTLYNAVPVKNKYYTDKTFTKVISSFDSCLSNRADELHYSIDGRRLAQAFLNEIGVKKSPLLNRMKLTAMNDLILEGKL